MPMKVEAAIVTQKRPEAAYNTDSVNVNGKVMPREVIKNGYKGSGILSGSAYFAITSSLVEGFADATVEAFNERAGLFALSRNPVSVFSGFFEDCRAALLKMNHLPEELVCTGFYGRGTKVVLVKNGDAKLYLSRLGVCTPVTTEKVEDTTASFSGTVFSDVSEGDIFVLLGPGAAKVLGDREIEDILRISDGSVKRVVNYILKVALAAGGSEAISAIAVKVLETSIEDELNTAAFVAEENTDIVADAALEEAVTEKVEAEESAAQETEEAEEQKEDVIENFASVFAKNAQSVFDVNDVLEKISADEVADSTENADDAADAEVVSDEETAENAVAEYDVEEAIAALSEYEEAATDEAVAVADEAAGEQPAAEKSKKPLFFILGLLLTLVVAAVVAFVVVPAFTGSDEEPTAEETTVEEIADETTEEEASDEEPSAEETTDELTTEESTTEKPAAETTTNRKPSETTTAAAVVAPVETTTADSSESTTTEEEGTTETEESTSAEEITTAAETTTAASETTTNESTTAATGEEQE